MSARKKTENKRDTSSLVTSEKAQPMAPAAGGINLKKRLMTAGIMIPIVVMAAVYPQTWFILNVGKRYLLSDVNAGFPLLVLIEYSSIMVKILEYLNTK